MDGEPPPQLKRLVVIVHFRISDYHSLFRIIIISIQVYVHRRCMAWTLPSTYSTAYVLFAWPAFSPRSFFVQLLHGISGNC